MRASLYELFEAEGVTFSAGVPTIWLGLLQFMRERQPPVRYLEAHRGGRLLVPAGPDESL